MPVAVEREEFGSQVDEQIAQATGRIRAHDLMLGGLTLAALAAVYATAMIVIDQSFNLPEWVRQIALAGFLVVSAGLCYWLVIRPLRKRINPLYAAARVEQTIDDPKNSVTGYVEAREKGDIHNAVKTAMGARAARAVGEADVNKAVDHRSLIAAGGVLILFLLALAVLFFVFRPAQFSSLMNRALFPFSADAIAKRTVIDIVKPEPPDPTITTGQTINVAVHISGKVPNANAADRVRLLLRHNPADPNFEEIPMEEGDTSRDWHAKVPDYLVQNGFWYKVAAGDNETPEYRVTVRTLPMFETYESTYEYPAYTRKPKDRATGPNIRAYRGTKVTLIGNTNREVKDGQLKFEAANLQPVVGKPVPGRPNSLEFKFTAAESSRYKLFLTATNGERNTDAPSFQFTLDTDLAPVVQITKPEEAETNVVANGQLQVDGTVGDDFGIDKLRLRMRIDGRDLAPVPYMGGQSFRREKDNTWPTDLSFKLSADLATLKYADGLPFRPRFGGENPPVIEYWVEAIDNCTEAKPVADWDKQVGNVGRSSVKRLRLTPPEMTPEKKQEIDNQKQQRGMEEQQHNQEQQKNLENEDRRKPDEKDGKPKDEQKKNGEGEPKTGEPTPKEGELKPKESEPKEGNPKKDREPKEGDPTKGGEPKEGDPKKGGNSKEGGKKDPDAKGENKTGEGGMSDPMTPKKGEKSEESKSPPDKTPATGADMGMGGKTDPGTSPPKPSESKKGGEAGKSDAAGGTTGMQDPQGAPPMAPMPQSPEDKRAEEEARKNAERVQEELNRNKSPAGDAKPNQTAGAEENRAEPSEPKPHPPEPGKGMEPESKPQPKPGESKPGEPMPKGGEKGGERNSASESRPAGNLDQKPNPDSAAKPGPQQTDPKQPAKQQPQTSETRSEPLGSPPGQDKPEPKVDPKAEQKTDPKDGKNENRDGKSGSTAKPPTGEPEPKEGNAGAQPEPKKDPGNKAATTKPNTEPKRGDDRPGEPQNAEPKPNEQAAGEAKPRQAPPSAESKPPQKKGDPMAAKQPDMSEAKPGPSEKKDPADPKDSAAEARPDTQKKPMGGMGDMANKDQKRVDRGEDKPGEQQAGGAKKDGDKSSAMGKKGEKGAKGDGKGEQKLDAAKQKELENAVKDLTDPDPNKQQAARDKLDKEIGKESREIIEEGQKQRKAELDKLQEDLKSSNEQTRDAAKKRLEELQDQARKDAEKGGKESGKGRELTQEEIKELAEKARDLNSKDDKKRDAAEKAFDDKLGKDGREKLQEEMKKRDNDPGKKFGPEDEKNLQKKIDDIAKNVPREGTGPITDHNSRSGASSEDLKAQMEDDPRNRARTAQLQLEEFEKHRYDQDLHKKLGWTPDQYEKFLKDQEDRVAQMQKEADAFEQAQLGQPKSALPDPKIVLNTPGKVDGSEEGSRIEVKGTRSFVPPPGFGGAREKFSTPRTKKP